VPAGRTRAVRGQRQGRGWAWGVVLETSPCMLGCGVCVFVSWREEEQEEDARMGRW
jgi:hypothetical protein